MSTIVTRSGKGSPLTNTEVDANFTNLNTGKAELSGAVFTGAITTNSTIDGRDVATDGTKLDGVEASADVTDATNVTAAGALMDSELTSIASVKALNQGVATGDSPTFAAVTSTGEITANGGIALGDNDKATFGASDDLQLYHSGSHSYLLDNGTGDLKIYGANIEIGNTSGVKNLYATSGGATKLYHNNSEKIATTSTGIDVTGTVTATGTSVFASLDISGNIDVDGVTNLDVVDIDGAVDMASTLAVGGRVTAAGVTTSAALISTSNSNNLGNTIISALAIDNFTIDGTTLALSSGNMTLDSAGDINLDAGGADVTFKNSGTEFGRVFGSSDNFYIQARQSDKDMIFQGIDGGSTITALTLDMSAAGAATFSSTIAATGATLSGALELDASGNIPTNGIALHTNNFVYLKGGSSGLIASSQSGGENFRLNANGIVFNEDSGDLDFRVESDGNANMLFVDGGADSVGIGTGSPSSTYKLDVSGAVRSTANAPSFNLQESDASNQHWVFGSYAGTLALRDVTGGTYPVQIANSGVTTNALNILAGETVINDNSADRDFRVETDAISNGFVVNANGAVCVGRDNAWAFGTNTAPGFAVNAATGRLDVSADSVARITQINDSTGIYDRFYRAGSIVGSITTNGSNTAYNTSSDQRLKENIADADDSGSKVDAIQVRKFDWKADGSHQDYGMVAQELLEVAPDAVHQPEDLEEMMGVDYSKLVPMLIKEIQSLRQRVASLEE